MDGLTELEKKRAANIAYNQARLAAAGLDRPGIERTCPDLIRPLVSRRQRCTHAPVQPLQVQLRPRGAPPQYRDEDNNGADQDEGASSSRTTSTTSDSYTPSSDMSEEDAGAALAALVSCAADADKVAEWEDHLYEV